MAGTLTIDTLKDGAGNTGSATDAIKGSARAWVSFVGSSAATKRASYNVSSITYNGAGDYTVTFTNSMVDTNYCALVATEGNPGWPAEIRDSSFYPGSVTTGSIRVKTGKTPTSYEDFNTGVFVAVFR